MEEIRRIIVDCGALQATEVLIEEFGRGGVRRPGAPAAGRAAEDRAPEAGRSHSQPRRLRPNCQGRAVLASPCAARTTEVCAVRGPPGLRDCCRFRLQGRVLPGQGLGPAADFGFAPFPQGVDGPAAQGIVRA